MNQPKILLFIAFVFCLSVFETSAQTPNNRPAEPSFDIVLQTIVGSNANTDKSDVTPAALSGIVKKLKSDFPFANYRLTSTAFQRISNRGNLESKSVSYLSDKNLAVFSEWSINYLENSIDEKGLDLIQIQNFRFGQKVPINTVNNTPNYEQIGLNSRFSLVKNMPTIVGSLATSKSDELMFLVLTVKSAEK